MKQSYCIYIVLLFTGLLALGNAAFLQNQGAAPGIDPVVFHVPKRNSPDAYPAAPANGGVRRLLQDQLLGNTGGAPTTISGDSGAANGTSAPGSENNSTTEVNSTTGVLPGENSTTIPTETNTSTANAANVSCTNNSDGTSDCTNTSVNCSTNVDGSISCTNHTSVCHNNTAGTSNCTNTTVQAQCVNTSTTSVTCTNNTETCVHNADGTPNCTNSTDTFIIPVGTSTSNETTTPVTNNTAGNVTCVNNTDGTSVCTNSSSNCTTLEDGSTSCTNITNVCNISIAGAAECANTTETCLTHLDASVNCTNATVENFCVSNNNGSNTCNINQTNCNNGTDGSSNCANLLTACVVLLADGSNNCTGTFTQTTCVNGTDGVLNCTQSSNVVGEVNGTNPDNSTNATNSSSGGPVSNCSTNVDGSTTCFVNSLLCFNSSDATASIDNCTNFTSVCSNNTDNSGACTNTTEVCQNNTDGTVNCTNNTVVSACDNLGACTDTTFQCENHTDGGSNCTNNTQINVCVNNTDNTTACLETEITCQYDHFGNANCSTLVTTCNRTENGTSNNCTVATLWSFCTVNNDSTTSCTNTTVICTPNENGTQNCESSVVGNNTDNTTTPEPTVGGTGLPDGTQVSVGNCDESCRTCFGASKYHCNGCYSNATLVWIGEIGICAPQVDSSVVPTGSAVTYPSTNLPVCTTSWMSLVDCARLTETYLQNLYIGHFVTHANGVQTVALQANSNSDICMTCMLVDLVVVNKDLNITKIPYTVTSSNSAVGTTNHSFIANINNADLAGYGCDLTHPDANTTVYTCKMQLIFTALNTTTSFYDFDLVTNINNNVVDDLSVAAVPGGSDIGGPTGSINDNTSVINVTQHNGTSTCLNGDCETNLTSTGGIDICADALCTSNKTNNIYTPNETLIIKQTINDLQGFNFTLTKESIQALDANGNLVADLTSVTTQTQGPLYVVYSIPLTATSGQVTFSITSKIVPYNGPASRRHLQGTSTYLNQERTTKFKIFVESKTGTDSVGPSAGGNSTSWWIIGAIAIGALIVISLLVICVFQMRKNSQKGRGNLPKVKFDPVMTVPNRV